MASGLHLEIGRWSALVGEGSVFAPAPSTRGPHCSLIVWCVVVLTTIYFSELTGEGSALAPAPGNVLFGFVSSVLAAVLTLKLITSC